MIEIVIQPFKQEDVKSIASILKGVGWAQQYVESQLKYLQTLSQNDEGEIWVASKGYQIAGFITVQHHKWNRLSFVHGLVVSIDNQRIGVGKKLMEHVESRTRERGNRGVQLDTPVDNTGAINFYKAIGYKESYIMPEYYEPGLDGLTFQKLFNK